eukprot:4233783-Amphidinium_carterae.1
MVHFRSRSVHDIRNSVEETSLSSSGNSLAQHAGYHAHLEQLIDAHRPRSLPPALSTPHIASPCHCLQLTSAA